MDTLSPPAWSPNFAPRQPPLPTSLNQRPVSIFHSSPRAVYKGCTRDAHRVLMVKSDEHPVSIPCT
ncbi:MAG: hypothetical protein QM840_04045, partial [Verrucomicrobiota bacterium]|nr:hypothetical protein [Verrucomicrobiota bacterium]